MSPRPTSVFRPAAPLRAAWVGAALSLAVPAFAAPGYPPYKVADTSTRGLMTEPAALAIWAEALPEDRLVKVYSSRQWGFLSQVEGGLVTGGAGGAVCVVTARAAMLPLTSPTRRLVWEPSKISTTFDARPNATAAQCSELAAAKLKEAVQSLVSGLIKP